MSTEIRPSDIYRSDGEHFMQTLETLVTLAKRARDELDKSAHLIGNPPEKYGAIRELIADLDAVIAMFPMPRAKETPMPDPIMTFRQIELARHALGMPNERRCSYRNRYYVGYGMPREHVEWNKMVETGMARIGRGDFFRLTRAGAEAALSPGETLDLENFPG